MTKEFNLSEKIQDYGNEDDGLYVVPIADIKEFIKRDKKISNQLAEKIFELQRKGKKIDIFVLMAERNLKRDKLAGDKLC